MAPVRVVGAAIVDSLERPTRLLAGRRSAPPALAGLWEFPGGKVEPGEDATQALVRELREELGIEARVGAEVPAGSRALEETGWGWPLKPGASMRVFFAEVSGGEPAPLEDHDELRWLSLSAGSDGVVESVEWIPADLPIVSAVVEAAAR